MLSWDTVQRLIRDARSNPLLIGLIVEELEQCIEELQSRREANNGTATLTPVEEELLRGFMLKRYLLIKKLRDRFRVQDMDDPRNQDAVAREYTKGRLTEPK